MLELEEACLKSEQQIALQQISAASACLACLEKQQEFLCKRAAVILYYSLQMLDKLDAQEEKEQQKKLELETKKKKET